MTRTPVPVEREQQPQTHEPMPAPVNTLKRALPHLLDRVNDPAITDLSPVESAARDWKENVVRDCGGLTTLTTARLALIASATGSWIILNTIDRYILDLAATEGLTS